MKPRLIKTPRAIFILMLSSMDFVYIDDISGSTFKRNGLPMGIPSGQVSFQCLVTCSCMPCSSELPSSVQRPCVPNVPAYCRNPSISHFSSRPRVSFEPVHAQVFSQLLLCAHFAIDCCLPAHRGTILGMGVRACSPASNAAERRYFLVPSKKNARTPTRLGGL